MQINVILPCKYLSSCSSLFSRSHGGCLFLSSFYNLFILSRWISSTLLEYMENNLINDETTNQVSFYLCVVSKKNKKNCAFLNVLNSEDLKIGQWNRRLTYKAISFGPPLASYLFLWVYEKIYILFS